MNTKHLFIMVLFASAPLWAYDEPKYKVIKEFDEFEIRQYESFVVAQVEVDQDFEAAGDSAFQPLFQYISGNNVSREEMEMTIPVNMSGSPESGEEMEMTIPVSQSGIMNNDGKYVINFVLPLNYTIETAPEPKDERVSVKEIPPKVMAVLEYSGTWSQENYREHENELFTELKKNDLKIIGQPVFARYNPPFWPWFLRRNEVMVQVDYKQQ